jgi:hypothetical protein
MSGKITNDNMAVDDTTTPVLTGTLIGSGFANPHDIKRGNTRPCIVVSAFLPT